jgi:hypothetical protein
MSYPLARLMQLEVYDDTPEEEYEQEFRLIERMAHADDKFHKLLYYDLEVRKVYVDIYNFDCVKANYENDAEKLKKVRDDRRSIKASCCVRRSDSDVW